MVYLLLLIVALALVAYLAWKKPGDAIALVVFLFFYGLYAFINSLVRIEHEIAEIEEDLDILEKKIIL